MQGYDTEMNLGFRQETIGSLLRAGANPNAMNDITLMRCLHWACFYTEDHVTVAALLDYGADPFCFDHEGFTPMDIAGIMSEEKLKNKPKEKIEDNKGSSIRRDVFI